MGLLIAALIGGAIGLLVVRFIVSCIDQLL